MTKPRECPFCGAQWWGSHKFVYIRHRLGCYLATGKEWAIKTPWRDLDAWNRRYTDAVATNECKVTSEVKE